ncbi:MAG: branched-chain amino acid ABC transporter permease [Burkholderiales bacterium]|nr:branched-chain amino acid ABC transporter permease [Burkholderiales bacterium]
MIEQMAINGLLSGFVYVIMALGFTLIFGIMRIVNFAHGELYMISAFAMLLLYGSYGVNYFVALPVAVLITAAVGALLERFLFRRFVGNELGGMIMSLALAILLQALALMLFGPDEQTMARPVSGVWRIGDAVVSLDRALVALCALVALIAFYFFIKFTRLGLAMQAVAQDRETASLMGIEANSIYLASFAIGAGLAGVAGALMAPVYNVSPNMGELPLLKAFVVVILGGLGSIPGALLGGLLIGVSESVFATLFNSTIALIASFAIVFLVIIVRPRGLLGKAMR